MIALPTNRYVDPGVYATGVAEYVGGRLTRAWLSAGATLRESIAAARTCALYNLANIVIVERPQVYAAGKQEGDPNDLISIALVAGAWATTAPGCRFVLPYEWKGQVPKAKMHARMLSDANPDRPEHRPLDAEERKILGELACPAKLRHNVYDAVCMGLVMEGRLKR